MTTPAELTNNQQILLHAVLDSPRTTSQLGAILNEHGSPFGDAARPAMARMEKRGLVVGEGVGSTREWTALDAPARAALGLPSLDSTRDSGLRGYVVLEEVKLDEIEMDDLAALASRGGGAVYVKVAEVVGRNTEHAYRQAAKDAYANSDAAPVLVAIAEKQFRPITVRVQTRQTVSMG